MSDASEINEQVQAAVKAVEGLVGGVIDEVAAVGSAIADRGRMRARGEKVPSFGDLVDAEKLKAALGASDLGAKPNLQEAVQLVQQNLHGPNPGESNVAALAEREYVSRKSDELFKKETGHTLEEGHRFLPGEDQDAANKRMTAEFDRSVQLAVRIRQEEGTKGFYVGDVREPSAPPQTPGSGAPPAPDGPQR